MADTASDKHADRTTNPNPGLSPGVRLEGIVCFETLQRLLLEPMRLSERRFTGVAASFARRSTRQQHIGGICYGLTLPPFQPGRWRAHLLVRLAHAAALGSTGRALHRLAGGTRPLFLWLFNPTDLRRWQPPARFNSRRQPISLDELDQDDWLASACTLLREELSVICQTLDFPPEAMSGLTRNGLLTMHAIRLRQLERWPWPRLAARKITQMIA